MTERGLHADPEKKSLFSAAKAVKHLTPAIGTEIHGVDLRQLSDQQKDELWVLQLLHVIPHVKWLPLTVPFLLLSVVLSVSSSCCSATKSAI